MSLPRYTKEELLLAVSSNYSFAGVLRSLNIVPAGGNYSVVKKYIRIWEINISHFTYKAWSRGKKLGPKTPITNLLVKNKTVNTHRLKQRLLNENIFPYQCSRCKQKTWLEVPISLELHHKDGDRTNNEIDNICLLCPNCHALTDNYRGKNITYKSPENKKQNTTLTKQNTKPTELPNLCSCGKTISKKAKMCIKCSNLSHRKIEWPDVNTLLEMIVNSNIHQIGKQLGVSDNAIRKHIKNYGASGEI